MALYEQYLAALGNGEGRDRALADLASLGAELNNAEVASALQDARQRLRKEGKTQLAIDLLTLQIENASEDESVAELLLEKARLCAYELLAEDEGRKCLAQLLSLRPNDETGQRLLEELDTLHQKWGEVADKYYGEAESATYRPLAAFLYTRAGELHLRYGIAGDAKRCITRALDIDPGNSKALAASVQIANAGKKWQELADVLRKIPANETAIEQTNRLWELAQTFREKLNKPAASARALRELLSKAPEHRPAILALVEIHTEAKRWNDLVSVLEMEQALWPAGSPDHLRIGCKISEVWARNLGNAAQALSKLESLYASNPESKDVRELLAAHYRQRRQWRPLAALLEQELDKLGGPDAAVESEESLPIHVELATMYGSSLGEPGKAAIHWRAVCDSQYADDKQIRSAKQAMVPLLEKSESHDELRQLLEEEIGREDSIGPRIAVAERLGLLALNRMHDIPLATKVYRDILVWQPGHIKSQRVLKGLLIEAADVSGLEELLGAQGRQSELVDVLGTLAEKKSGNEHVAILRRQAELCENELSDERRAVRIYERILSQRPNDEDALRKLSTLHENSGRWLKLLSINDSLLTLELGVGEELALTKHSLEIADKRLGSKKQAFFWAKRLFLIEQTEEVGARLVEAAHDKDCLADLWEIFKEEVDSPGIQEHECLAFLRILVDFCPALFKEPEAEFELLNRIIDLEPGDPDALSRMADLARNEGNIPVLIEALSKQVRSTADDDFERTASLELANVHASLAGDLDAASLTLRSLNDRFPDETRAIERLVKVEKLRGDLDGQIGALEKAIQCDGMSPVPYLLQLGKLLQQTDDGVVRAVQLFDRGLSLGNLEAIDELQQLAFSTTHPQGKIDALAALEDAYRSQGQAESLAKVLEERLVVFAEEADRAEATPEKSINTLEELVELWASAGRHDKSFEAAKKLFLAGENKDAQFDAVIARGKKISRDLEFALDVEHKTVNGTLFQPQFWYEKLAEYYRQEGRKPDEVRVLELLWQEAPGHDLAAEELANAYQKAKAWQKLAHLWQERVLISQHASEKAQLLEDLGALFADEIIDENAAAKVFEQCVDVDPSREKAIERLISLQTQLENWAGLQRTLGLHIDVASSDSEKAERQIQLARLFHSKLHQCSEAHQICRDLLSRGAEEKSAESILVALRGNPSISEQATESLREHYRSTGSWYRLRDLLVGVADDTEDLETKKRVMFDIARLEENELEDGSEALEIWVARWRMDFADADSVENVRRLAMALGRYGRLAELLEEAKACSADDDTLPMLLELGQLYRQHLDDPTTALLCMQNAYSRHDITTDDREGLFDEMSNLYRETEQWQQLAELTEDYAGWAGYPEKLEEAADVYETKVGDTQKAIELWEVRNETPSPESLSALDRLYTQTGDLVKVAEVLVEKVYDCENPEDIWLRLATLYRDDLGEKEKAISAFRSLLDVDSESDVALWALADLYEEKEEYRSALEVLYSLKSNDPESPVATCRIAKLEHRELGEYQSASEHYASLIGSSMEQAGYEALVSMCQDSETFEFAWETTATLLERDRRFKELASILETAVQRAPEPIDRAELWKRISFVATKGLADSDYAFRAESERLVLLAGTDDVHDCLRRVEAVSLALPSKKPLLQTYRRSLPEIFDAEVIVQINLKAAALSKSLNENEGAILGHLQQALEADPENQIALRGIVAICEKSNLHDEHLDALTRLASLDETDVDDRLDFLRKSAVLLSDVFARNRDAVQVWKEVLELSPGDDDAYAALEDLYQSEKQWSDLAEIYQTRLGFVHSMKEGVAILLKRGQICQEHLQEHDSALECFAQVLDTTPGHSVALEGAKAYLDDPELSARSAEVLKPVFVARQDWHLLGRVLETELGQTDGDAERSYKLKELASLYEDQLGDLESANRWYIEMIPSVLQSRASSEFSAAQETLAAEDALNLHRQLHRLAKILDSWPQLADAYEDYLASTPAEVLIPDGNAADSGQAGVPSWQSVGMLLGDIYLQRMQTPGKAAETYRQIFDLNAADIRSLSGLRDSLTADEDWEQLVSVLEIAADGCGVDEFSSDRAFAYRHSLMQEAARCAYQKKEDADRAIDIYQVMLEEAPFDDVFHEELLTLLFEERRYHLADSLLSARAVDGTGSHAQLRRAKLLETEIGDVEFALDQYESLLAQKSHPDWARAREALERLVVESDYRGRVLECLEPVYRERDWWQKLVVILDARLEFCRESDARIDILREIAQIHETRGGDPTLALQALEKAWLERPEDDGLFEELTAAAASNAAWDCLVNAIEKALPEQNVDFAREYLPVLANIWEIHQGNQDEAISIWYRALELSGENTAALYELARLLESRARFSELCDVLQRITEAEDDCDARINAFSRLAVIFELEENDNESAIEAHLSILDLSPGRMKSLEPLDRLYTEQRNWRGLAEVLASKIAQLDLAVDSRLVALRLANVYSAKLEDAESAIQVYRDLLDDSGNDREVLGLLRDELQKQEHWGDFVEASDSLLAVVEDDVTIAELQFVSARALIEQLEELSSGAARLSEVIALDPGHEGARTLLWELTDKEESLFSASETLLRVCRAENEMAAVATILEKRLAATPDTNDEASSERKRLFSEIAEIYQHALEKPGRAFEVLSTAIAEFPLEVDFKERFWLVGAAISSFDRVAEVVEAVLKDALELGSEPLVEQRYRIDVASVYDKNLEDSKSAVAHYWKATELGNPKLALSRLVAIYEREEDFESLGRALSEMSFALEDEEKLSEEYFKVLLRLAEVRGACLADQTGALECYQRILDRCPAHGETEAMLWKMLSASDSKEAVADILEPLIRSQQEPQKLLDLLAAKLLYVDDDPGRAAIYEEAARIAESEMQSDVKALDAAGGWARHAPQNEQAISELIRLGGKVDRYAEVAARLGDLATSADDPILKVELLVVQAKILADEMKDFEQAKGVLGVAISIEEDNLEVLGAFEQVLRKLGQEGVLAQTLHKRGGLVLDEKEAVACFGEAGELFYKNRDLAGSRASWAEVLRLDPENDSGALALLGLDRETENYPGLADTLRQRIDILSEKSEEDEGYIVIKSQVEELRIELAGALGQFADKRKVEAAWREVLEQNPSHGKAVEELVGILTAKRKWIDVRDVLEAQVAHVVETDDFPKASAIFLRLATLAAEKQKSIDDSVNYLQRACEIDLQSEDAVTRLTDTLRSKKRFHDLVDFLENRRVAIREAGDHESFLGLSHQIANVWLEDLNDGSAAVEALENALEVHPAHSATLLRLVELYENEGDVAKCESALELLFESGQDNAHLRFMAGFVHYKGGRLPEAQIELEKAIAHDVTNYQALALLADVHMENQKWELGLRVSLDAYKAVLASANDAGNGTHSADILEKLQRIIAAKNFDNILLEELAAVIKPEDLPLAAKQKLADMYYSREEWALAEPLFLDISEAARKSRNMTEVASTGLKLGKVYRLTNRHDLAVSAFQAAFRVNPTNVLVMAELGELFFETQNWKEARRIYRSMVLQNFNADAPLAKTEVYRRLGFAHEKLEELPQAKNMYQRGLDVDPNCEALKAALEAILDRLP